MVYKGKIYSGTVNGRDLRVMPVIVDRDGTIHFDIGQPFGNRLFFDGVPRGSMSQEAFERAFKPAGDDAGR